MHLVFIDSDVIMDVFAKREPFYENSAKVLTAIEKKKVTGFTSPLVFANTYYILRKLKTKEYALQSLRKLRIVIEVLPLDEKHIDQSLNSEFSDFEDAIQYYSAKSKNIDFIITRNTKHYKTSSISVCTPDEFLKILTSGK